MWSKAAASDRLAPFKTWQPSGFLLNPDFAGCWANPSIKPSQISTRLTGRLIRSVMTFPCLEGGTGSTFIVLLEVEGAAGHTSSADIFRTKLVSQSRTRPSQTASIPRAELSALAFTSMFRAFGSSVFTYFFCCWVLLAVEKWYEPKQNWKLRVVFTVGGKYIEATIQKDSGNPTWLERRTCTCRPTISYITVESWKGEQSSHVGLPVIKIDFANVPDHLV